MSRRLVAALHKGLDIRLLLVCDRTAHRDFGCLAFCYIVFDYEVGLVAVFVYRIEPDLCQFVRQVCSCDFSCSVFLVIRQFCARDDIISVFVFRSCRQEDALINISEVMIFFRIVCRIEYSAASISGCYNISSVNESLFTLAAQHILYAVDPGFACCLIDLFRYLECSVRSLEFESYFSYWFFKAGLAGIED